MKKFLVFLLFSCPLFGQTAANVGALKLSTPGDFTGAQPKQHSFVAVGGIDMAGEFSSLCKGCRYMEEAIAGGIEVPAGTSNVGDIGISGYCVTHADSRFHGSGPPSQVANCGGGFFHAHAAANYSAVWGINPMAYDEKGITGHSIIGMEIDMGVQGTPAQVIGIQLPGGDPGINYGTMPANSAGISIQAPHPLEYQLGAIVIGAHASKIGLSIFPDCFLAGSPSCPSGVIQLAGQSAGKAQQTYLGADSHGNQVMTQIPANASLVSTRGYSFPFPNNGGAPTANNKLAILADGTTATVAPAGTANGVIGLVVNSAGTSGSATILVMGPGTCSFDGPTIAGHYFQASGQIAGDCHDAGSAKSRSNQNLGLITQSVGGEGNATVLMELVP
jgi:hypothetical protein